MSKLSIKFFIVTSILIFTGILCYLFFYVNRSSQGQKINDKVIRYDFEERSFLKIDADLSTSEFNYTQISYTAFEEHLNFKLFNNENCGPFFKGCRIEGGKQAYLKEFPWFAALMSDNNLFCGGSLISEKLVLTAAHCIPKNLDM